MKTEETQVLRDNMLATIDKLRQSRVPSKLHLLRKKARTVKVNKTARPK